MERWFTIENMTRVNPIVFFFFNFKIFNSVEKQLKLSPCMLKEHLNSVTFRIAKSS